MECSATFRVLFYAVEDSKYNYFNSPVLLSATLGHQHGRYYKKIVKRQVTSVTCDRNARYRLTDGRCNNLDNINWGSVTSPLARLLPSKYSDGVGTPRSKSVTGSDLPSAREVSVKLHTALDARSDVTLMVMQWGQFIDHDVTLTPFAVESDGTHITCTCASTSNDCFNIPLQNDEYFNTRECLEFTRSAGTIEADQFGQAVRQQQNAITSFIDASNVYGSSDEELDHLTGPNGTLLERQGQLLPQGEPGSCLTTGDETCFLAGDERVNEQPGLTAMHTIFMREHNRIARTFKQNTAWDDQVIFQETRKIIEASLQRITYSEFLPIILAPIYMDNYQLRDTFYLYNPNDQPDISNAFATAAYRFGHTLIPEGIIVNSQLLEFKNLFLSPTAILSSFQNVTNALSNENSMAFDGHFSHSVTRHLFEAGDKTGFDLVALNIQRARDHGLPSYNEYRAICSLPKLTSLRQLFPNNPEARSVYDSIDDVDLFTGGMTEPAVPGGLLGPTFSCILSVQFKKLKAGDRFFYLNNAANTGFTRDQINEINKVTLGKIICTNTPRRDIQPNVFLPESRSNQERRCRDIPSLDLRKWTQPGRDGGGGGQRPRNGRGRRNRH